MFSRLSNNGRICPKSKKLHWARNILQRSISKRNKTKKAKQLLKNLLHIKLKQLLILLHLYQKLIFQLSMSIHPSFLIDEKKMETLSLIEIQSNTLKIKNHRDLPIPLQLQRLRQINMIKHQLNIERTIDIFNSISIITLNLLRNILTGTLFRYLILSS